MKQRISANWVLTCPHLDCKCRSRELEGQKPKARSPDSGLRVRKSIAYHGRYYRKDDGKWIVRFRCLRCRRTFASARFFPTYRQKKRTKNRFIYEHLCSLTSMRRIARLAHVNRKTVTRKLRFLAQIGRARREAWLKKLQVDGLSFSEVQLDEMRSSVVSKCLPVSIPIIVTKDRQILGVKVGEIPANGPLAEISRKKYGPRKNEREEKMSELLTELQGVISPAAIFKTDQDSMYPSWIHRHFPEAKHIRVKGQRGRSDGQGELKKTGFDSLFALNHTAAMNRANVSRLIRRTWNLSKRKDHLEMHLEIYARYHNEILLQEPSR